MSDATPGPDSTLGDRIKFAIALEGRTQNATENGLMLRHPDVFRSRGFMSSYISGRRGKEAPNPKIIKLIADFLHVEFEWLLLGTGPERRDGREQSPAEIAMRFAREMGIREDAWEHAWARNKDREDEMSAADWFNAIKSEGEYLERTQIPHPKALVEDMDHRARVRRAAAKKKRQQKGKPNEPVDQQEVPSTPAPRVARVK